MKILVYGLGRSGTAVARLLVKQRHEVVYFDQNPLERERTELNALGCQPTLHPQAVEADLCIAAPGVPWDHPDLQALRARSMEVIGEVEWVYRTVPATILGVTGTAGKGTVTRWLSDTLTDAGMNAPAGGNIDPALASVAEAGAVLVTELSSFQLERCPTLKPKVAVVLNLGVDHLDRHGTVQNYHETKRAILRNQDASDTFIYNEDDHRLRGWARHTPAKTLSFSIRNRTDAYLQTEGDQLRLMLHDQPLLNVSEMQITGTHQYANALAVALACDAMGLRREQIQHGLMTFQGLPGRYSLVDTLESPFGDIRFIEDSIATRTLAVRAALEATPSPIVWIGGGVDKGASFTELEPLAQERVSLFVGIGTAGPVFAQRLSGVTQIHVRHETNGEDAMRSAIEAGLEHLAGLKTGGTILLAPLGASFDQFRDYRDRALTFRRVVAQAVREAPWTRS
jgi:UDP-N-acetylmuramoylalanine--D-glutamate ligase